MRFLVVIFSLFFLEVKSQPTIFNYYPDQHFSYLEKMIETNDGGYVALADRYHFAPNGDSIIVCKFDSNGNSLWAKNYFFPGHILYTGDLIEMPDQSLVVSGAIYKPSVINTFFILKLDSFGNIIKFQISGDSARVAGNQWGGINIAGIDNSLNYYLCGNTGNPADSNWAFFVSKIDTIGNVQWSKYFEPDTNVHIDRIKSIMTIDSNLVISGFEEHDDSIVTYQFFIYKIDRSGNVIYSKRLSTETFNATAASPIELFDSYYFLSREETNANGRINAYKVGSTNGELIWHHRYGAYVPDVDKNFCALTGDNQIIFIARSLQALEPLYITIDSSGFATDSKIYSLPMSFDYHSYFVNSVLKSSGKSFLYGIHEDFTNNVSGILLAETDSMNLKCYSLDFPFPTVTSLSDSLVNTGIEFPFVLSLSDLTSSIQSASFTLPAVDVCEYLTTSNLNDQKYFEIFPNPASTIISVHLHSQAQESTLKIFNLTGQIIFSKSIFSGDETINIENFPQGIYFVRLETGKVISVRKLIVK